MLFFTKFVSKMMQNYFQNHPQPTLLPRRGFTRRHRQHSLAARAGLLRSIRRKSLDYRLGPRSPRFALVRRNWIEHNGNMKIECRFSGGSRRGKCEK